MYDGSRNQKQGIKIVKAVKYYLLLRDPFPMMGKDGKRSSSYNWEAWAEGSLNYVRKHQKQVEGKTKIIREETITETVKEGDSY